jgi:hypothetical protein
MNPQLPGPISENTHPDVPDHSQLDRSHLDQVLLDDTLVPSSGFAASVMDAITAQSAAPAPIPFPWKLALPGLAAFLIALIAAVRLALQLRHSAIATLALNPAWFTSHSIVNQSVQACVALAGAFLCLLLTRYLALGRSTR